MGGICRYRWVVMRYQNGVIKGKLIILNQEIEVWYCTATLVSLPLEVGKRRQEIYFIGCLVYGMLLVCLIFDVLFPNKNGQDFIIVVAVGTCDHFCTQVMFP